jgi:hypothetical protein
LLRELRYRRGAPVNVGLHVYRGDLYDWRGWAWRLSVLLSEPKTGERMTSHCNK